MAKLYFYYSAMNAGKTTTLLQSAHNYRERGMRVAILTPKLDHRAGSGVVASRIGLSSDARTFDESTDIFAEVSALNAEAPVACVFIDEANFLSEHHVWQLAAIADRLNIPLRDRNAALLAGLQTKNILDGGKATFQGSYAETVSFVGNKTREVQVSGLASMALLQQTSTQQQAVSGVNLDEEAANLLRYQQAYQACGKVMQIASTLFDVVIGLGR